MQSSVLGHSQGFVGFRHVFVAKKINYCFNGFTNSIPSSLKGTPVESKFFLQRKNEKATYDVKLQEVSEARGAVHPHQDGVLQVRAEANGQAVRPRAGTVVWRPCVRDQPTVSPEYVGGSR